MKQRIIVLLKIDNVLYKFLSILQNKSDPSIYIYQHIKDEKSPITIAYSFHLLKTSGNFNTNRLKKRMENDGDRTHLSIHPNRIYLKRLNNDGSKEHLIEEYEPQPFNINGFRLYAIFTPPPPSHMSVYISKKNVREVVFIWNNPMCPQLSLYELGQSFDLRKVNILPPSDRVEIIPSDGVHPSVALHLKSTNGTPGVWMPNCAIFGKVVKKKPISKKELQEVINYNELNFDISSIPDNAVITNYKIDYPKEEK